MWSSFWELDATRSGNGYAAHPISHLDMHAFQSLSGVTLRDWERRAIIAMDRCRLDWLNAPEGERPAAAVSSRPVSTALFDALFD